ncbi:putative bifunctional diguanylate cyclase/phosphodiesterase, partial [Vibrio sp.]|uniref:putative bifunctional diguanylate cyclase/phosphodiesterase n=1 Tax=Vibrio sp. TaxID=678 RepID=UPI003D0F161F
GALSGKLYFEAPAENYNFKILSWYEPLNEQDVFTSKMFIYGLSILGIIIILGLFYAFVLNNAQVELKIKLEEEQKRKAILSKQNHKLTEEIAKRKASESELAYQAKHDLLTNLPNRSYALEKLSLELARAQRSGSQILVMYIDLDNFKQINDSMGHFVGDEILKLCVQRLQHAVRKTDVLARIGGDEFLLIIPDLPDHEAAKRLAVVLLNEFEKPYVWQNHECFLSASIGMSIYPKDGESLEQLVASADMAMYRVKQEGRNGFCFYNHNMNYDLQRFLELENRLRNAIANNLLELYYQPIINLENGEVVGAEALMRWNDEKHGFVNPEEFISIAERNGLIHQLGEFAIKQACQQAALWQEIVPLFVSVNFSSIQFRYCERLLKQIETSLKLSGLPGEKFDVEVTESLFFNHSNELISMLDKLREQNVKLTIDDFGTGYSALSYIQRFPFDRLKIDRSFIKDMFENESDKELVNVIIAMAKALGLKIIAEGIEDQQHVDYLKQMQCDYGQGFYFSRPLPSIEFEAYLREATGKSSSPRLA